MNRDRMRTIVAIVVIAAMVLLAAGALGASLLGGAPDPANAAPRSAEQQG